MIIPDDDDPPPGETVALTLAAEDAGGRLDKTLAEHLPDLSRARIQALMAQGLVSRGGRVLTDTSAKAQAGDYELLIPPPEAAEPQAEAIPLTVLYEDAHLIVVDKPPGMAVHPAPGTPNGTLVNALLAHCGASLSGIGGVARPGIVHRIDKETSGVVVVAKTDAAHQGLSALFAAHDIDRVYVALVRGAPSPARGTITTQIGRSSSDRKKMAVLKSGGREAITHYATTAVYGPQKKPLAAKLECRLETGRTHQIRVHMAAKGSPCLGDPVYGSGPPAPAVREAMGKAGLTRQALHAAVLGFVHPVTGEPLRFQSALPPDMAQLEALLSAL
ncbi:RluA family pseudouridine synthase [Phenylobacterium sp.]|uniref:RluA family pseudouridine synthase n=1 Tax=Phenylobacterium sp. TaxID=1871053 RepID=UPI00351DDC72